MHQLITRDADVLPGSPMSWGTVLAALRTNEKRKGSKEVTHAPVDHQGC